MSVGTMLQLYSADGVHQVQMSVPESMAKNAKFVFPGDNGEAGAALISDGLGAASWSSSAVQYANVAVSSAQILALSTTPVVVVAAPGAGKFIEFISGMISYTYSGAAYTGGGNVAFGYTGQAAVSAAVTAGNSFGNGAAQIWTVLPSGNGGGASATFVNLGITFRALADFTQPGAAAGTARVAVAYRVHSSI